MIENQFNALEARYEELLTASEQNDVVTDIALFRRIQKELNELEPKMDTWKRYLALEEAIAQAQDMQSDPDLGDMAQEELRALLPEKERMRHELKLLLIPRDEDDERNVVVEVRPGAGGDEAALFAALLTRMYQRYAEKHRLKFESVSLSDTELGGVKEAVFTLSGSGAYAALKHESGVHRIQRVPVTEAGGRIHTSTATVAVLPEAEDVEVNIDPGDVRIDTYRASGHGGQYINRTDSAVRLTHLPTGLVVTCQDEKSQLKNKEKAFKVLKSRLYDLYRQQKDRAYAENRRAQVGSGERNERIRTYNFPQGRVTDHRVNLTLYKIDAVMDGELDEIIDALRLREQEEKLRALEGSM
ncbi:MAG: peptide chain release factor 1 [Clostridiales bacterium]|nr:peptide chain release factor 1 [Clostridiales bacterium]